MMQGAGSLVKQTISGTFNSLGKITGSLATGLSTLTMDDEYMSMRDKAKMKRPKHAAEGLAQGVKSIFSGVEKGITGVFLKPFEGGKKGGLTGFMKGTVQGLTGLVVKPVTGIFDAASKTSEGIKNTATFFDERPSESRFRYPRAFYGKDRYYKVYIDTDAELLFYLNTYKEGNYEGFPILNSYDVFPSEKEKEVCNIFALATDLTLCWSLKKKAVLWEIDLENIEKVMETKEGIEIYGKKKTTKMPDKKVVLQNCDHAQNGYIYKKLVELKDSYVQVVVPVQQVAPMSK